MMPPILQDTIVMTAGAAADELSTQHTLSTCASCREAGPPAPLRYAGKALTTGVLVASAHQLRKTGHRKWAKAVIWIPAAVWFGLAVHNETLSR